MNTISWWNQRIGVVYVDGGMQACKELSRELGVDQLGRHRGQARHRGAPPKRNRSIGMNAKAI